MKIKLILVGKTAFSFVKEGMILYEKRVQKYLSYKQVELADLKKSKSRDVKTLCREEGKKILAELNATDTVVLLDVGGRSFTSEKFADFLNQRMISSTKQLVFVVGGAYGFSEEVYERAQFLVSLSDMTFSHQLVRLLFVEQLYRGLSILEGDPYHH